METIGRWQTCDQETRHAAQFFRCSNLDSWRVITKGSSCFKEFGNEILSSQALPPHSCGALRAAAQHEYLRRASGLEQAPWPAAAGVAAGSLAELEATEARR